MNKAWSLIIVSILLLAGILFVPEFGEKPNLMICSGAKVVDLNGNGDYTKIQEAIDAVNPGETINVWTGDYTENVIINKTVTLIGNGTLKTTIDGGGKNDVVQITANQVSISGFGILNSGTVWNDAAIELKNVSNCNIKNNICTKSQIGIFINSSDSNNIENNICTQNDYGIYSIFSNGTVIANNSCTFNNKDGIKIYSSYKNKIKYNNCSTNTNGITLQSKSKVTATPPTDGTGYTSSSDKYIGNIKVQWFFAADVYRGWAKLDLSKIPDNANITRVVLKTDIITDTYVHKVGVRVLTNDPTTAAAGTVYSEAGSGTKLCSLPWSIGETSEDLTEFFDTPSGKTIMRNALNNDWLGLGFDFEASATNFGTYTGDMRGYQNDLPALEVEYVEYLNTTLNYHTLSNNNCSDNTINGIYLDSSDGNTVINNDCSNNQVGIKFSRAHENTVEDNICYANDYGIDIISSINNMLINNNCSSNTFGIALYKSTKNKIEKNSCSNNLKSGIDLISSNNNTIIRNTCFKNTEDGIRLQSSSFNILEKNHCYSNNNGISMAQPSQRTIILGTDNPQNAGDAMGFTYTSSLMVPGCHCNYYAITRLHTISMGSESRGWAVFDLKDLTRWSDVNVKSAKLLIHHNDSYRVNEVKFTALSTTPYNNPGDVMASTIHTESGSGGTQIGQHTITSITDTTKKTIEVTLNNNGVNAINNKIASNPTYYTFAVGIYISKLHSSYDQGSLNWSDIRLAVTFEYNRELQPTGSGNGIAFGDEWAGHLYKYTSPSNRPFGFTQTQKTSGSENLRGYSQWKISKIRQSFPQDFLSYIKITKVSLRFNHHMRSLTNIYIYPMRYNVTNTHPEDVYNDCGDGTSYYGPGSFSSTENVEYEWDLGTDAVNDFQNAFVDNNPDFFGLGIVTTSTSSNAIDYGLKLVIEWEYNFTGIILDEMIFSTCKYNVLMSNNCSANYNGISLENSSFNKLTGNDCSFNTNYGIHFKSAQNNELTNTNITYNNFYGIYLFGSYFNYIYHNNFIENNNQVLEFIFSYVNYWNNSDHQGNYWSDYMGWDMDGDGIGDSLIPHYNDMYPYTTKSGWLPPDPPVLADPGIYDSDGSYLLTWSTVVRGYKYSVLEDTVMDFSKSPKEIYNGTSTSFFVKNRVNGTYYYKVRAINTTYEKIGAWSNIENMIVDWLPDIPQNLLVSVYPEGNTLNLSWDLNSIDTKTYKIEYKTDLTDWTNLTTVDAPNNRYNHTGLIDGKKYYYRIIAVDARFQVSGYSEMVEGVPRDSIPPAMPTGLTVQEIGIGFVNISWSPNTESDVAGYSIYRESWARAMFLDITQHTWYLDTSLEDDKSYYYNITAFDEVPNYSPSTPALGPINIPKAPSIIQTDPTAGAVDVPIETTITVTFSKSMDVSSVESSFSISPEVDGTFKWSDQNKTFVYTPSTILPYSTFYALGIDTSVKDIQGNRLLSSYEWNFTTEDDLIKPTVIAHNPTGTNVPITTKITITFSEAMVHESVEAVFEITPYSVGTITWEGNILTFKPSGYLSYNTLYHVSLGIGAEDLAGNSLPAAYSWNFTTEAQEASIPEVIAYSPQGYNVLIDSDVTVEFIKPMNKSATKNAFIITPAIDGILTWYENVLIYTHSADFEYETTYNVTVSTAAEDLWGNHLPANFSWEFTTEVKIIEELPKIVVLRPVPGDEVEINTEIMVKFSKAISYPPAYLSVKDASDLAWVGNLTYDKDNNMLKFEPSAGEYLSYGTIYTVTLSGIEIDIGGFDINMVDVRGYLYSWTFKTKSQDEADTDQDGMDDKWEEDFKLNPFDETDAHSDLDEDGLKNIDEYKKGTEPNNKDTDGDGLNDFVEINEYQTDPLKIDTDDDNYPDDEEVDKGTDPLNPDDNPGTARDVTGDKGFGTYLLYIILAIIIIIIILLLVFSKLRRPEPEGELEAQKELGAEEDLEDWEVAEEDEEEPEEPEETEEGEEAEAPEPEDQAQELEAEELPSMEELGGTIDIDEDIFDDTELAVAVKKPKKGELKKKAKEPEKVSEKAKKKAKDEKPIRKKDTKAKTGEVLKPKKKGVKTEPDKPKLHTMEKIMKCNICFGNIKTGLNIITCGCGKHYHENCAKRVGSCPVCETSLKEPVDMTSEDAE